MIYKKKLEIVLLFKRTGIRREKNKNYTAKKLTYRLNLDNISVPLLCKVTKINLNGATFSHLDLCVCKSEVCSASEVQTE
jgi:hypothetical protein